MIDMIVGGEQLFIFVMEWFSLYVTQLAVLRVRSHAIHMLRMKKAPAKEGSR
jgi:hypothetical protein